MPGPATCVRPAHTNMSIASSPCVKLSGSTFDLSLTSHMTRVPLKAFGAGQEKPREFRIYFRYGLILLVFNATGLDVCIKWRL